MVQQQVARILSFVQHVETNQRGYLLTGRGIYLDAYKHAEETPAELGYDPPEGWGWCYVDEVFIDLSDRATPQLGPIPSYYR